MPYQVRHGGDQLVDTIDHPKGISDSGAERWATDNYGETATVHHYSRSKGTETRVPDEYAQGALRRVKAVVENEPKPRRFSS